MILRRQGPISIALALCLLAPIPGRAVGPSARPGMGSTPYAGLGGTGVTFRVWAPNASSVGVKGQFNGWATTSLTKEGASGLWSGDIAGASAGQQYKYVINGNSDKRDPRARRVTNSAGNSVVQDPNFEWAGDTPIPPWKNDLVIYEMHAGTFNAESYVPNTFDQAITKLDYLKNLGVSAIELMPINEFAGDKSWGYNPADLFAIESALGGPDAFKRFVKACHQRGIAVLVDVVHNHYGPSDLALWQFDGWSQNGKGGIYFYNDARSSTMWGETRPDYGRSEVRDFIKDQIRMYLNEYHVDGFRWDSVFNIIYYNNGGNALPDGVSLLREINEEIDATHPGTIRIAEDHGFDSNMSFDAIWEVSFHDHLKWQVTQSNDGDRNMYWLADKITAWPSLQRVLFSESHDMVGDLNGKYRLPRDIDPSNPTSIWARKRQLLAASMVMTAPGTPMIFQGQEMNEDWTFSSSTSLRWGLTNTWKGIVSAYGDLIHLRRNLRGGTQGLKGTGINAHHIDNQNKVLAFVRWDAGNGADDVVVVANFAVTTWSNNNYQVQFPSTGKWYTCFNGDSKNYGSDFGGIGSSFVIATGSPARAAVNMGAYSAYIFSKTPPARAGTVTTTPAVPSGCVPVRLVYQPGDGPLSNATPVVLSIGVNGWQNTTNITMTNAGAGAWGALFDVPANTAVLDFAFRNTSTNTTWDNNLGNDWHLGIVDCANLPSVAATTPVVPVGCVPVAFRYEEQSGPLSGASNITLYIGYNNWNDIQSIPLAENPAGIWTATNQIPDETWQLDFVFFGDVGTNRVWDNHNNANWRVLVADCAAAQFSGLQITNPPNDITVSENLTSYTLQGRAGADITGALKWTNSLTGADGSQAAATAWSIPSVALAEGANLIRVTGTNSGVNPNGSSRDASSNATYTVGPSWQNGQNGGSGWGGAWQLATSGNAGHFLANSGSESNLSQSAYGWGLWANNGGIASAIRPLAAPLHVGDVIAINLDNNWVSSGSSVGIGLQNRFGQNLFEFMFIGGGTNYLINDEETARDTGRPWTGSGLHVEFQLTTETTYAFSIGTQTVTGALAPTSEQVVNRIRAWNANAGGGFEYNFYITSISVTGAPLPVATFQNEATITRPFGPMSDQDGDGFTRWEEEFAGTDPTDASSHLPDLTNAPPSATWSVNFESSVPGRGYDLFFRTNLILGGWQRYGLEAVGWGGPLTLSVTNGPDMLFYRSGVYAR